MCVESHQEERLRFLVTHPAFGWAVNDLFRQSVDLIYFHNDMDSMSA